MFNWPNLNSQGIKNDSQQTGESSFNFIPNNSTNFTQSENWNKIELDEEEKFNKIFVKLTNEISELNRKRSIEEQQLSSNMTDPNYMPQPKCEAMCPELEFKNRKLVGNYSTFEVDASTNQFSHHLAIKDYDRSAADEKIPMPSEMRTQGALKRTMAFIIDNICDSAESSLDEWYEFIWSRTRAIRKELNQQHLSNELAIKILTVVLNFHLISQERLKHYDAQGNFDQKLNRENIIACFTDLLHIYESNNDFKNTDSHFKILFLYLVFKLGQKLSVSVTLNQMHCIVSKNNSCFIEKKFNKCLEFIDAYQTSNCFRVIKIWRELSPVEQCAFSPHIYSQNKTVLFNITNCYSPKITDEVVYIDPQKIVSIIGSNDDMWAKLLFDSAKDHHKIKKSRLFDSKKSFYLSLQNPLSGQTSFSKIIAGDYYHYFNNQLNKFDISANKPPINQKNKSPPGNEWQRDNKSELKPVAISHQDSLIKAAIKNESKPKLDTSSLEMEKYRNVKSEAVCSIVAQTISQIAQSNANRTYECHLKRQQRIAEIKTNTSRYCNCMIVEQISKKVVDSFLVSMKSKSFIDQIRTKINKLIIINGLKSWQKSCILWRRRQELLKDFSNQLSSNPSHISQSSYKTSHDGSSPSMTLPNIRSSFKFDGTDKFIEGLSHRDTSRLKDCAVDIVLLANEFDDFSNEVIKSFLSKSNAFNVDICNGDDFIYTLRKVFAKFENLRITSRLICIKKNSIDLSASKCNIDFNFTKSTILVPLVERNENLSPFISFVSNYKHLKLKLWSFSRSIAKNFEKLSDEFMVTSIANSSDHSLESSLKNFLNFLLQNSSKFHYKLVEKEFSHYAEAFFDDCLTSLPSSQNYYNTHKLVEMLSSLFGKDFENYIIGVCNLTKSYLQIFSYAHLDSTNRFSNFSMLHAFKSSHLHAFLNSLKSKVDEFFTDFEYQSKTSKVIVDEMKQKLLELCSNFKIFDVIDDKSKRRNLTFSQPLNLNSLDDDSYFIRKNHSIEPSAKRSFPFTKEQELDVRKKRHSNLPNNSNKNNNSNQSGNFNEEASLSGYEFNKSHDHQRLLNMINDEADEIRVSIAQRQQLL